MRRRRWRAEDEMKKEEGEGYLGGVLLDSSAVDELSRQMNTSNRVASLRRDLKHLHCLREV